MNHSSNTNNQLEITKRYFWLLISLHVLVWTLLPTLLRNVLPMDALEGAVWGQHLILGYDRNPWLNAWLTHFALVAGGDSGWLVYFFSQLCVLMAFYSVWQLAQKILTPFHALVTVFMLEAIQYYTLAAVDFNDNVLELGLWAGCALFFYKALTEKEIRNWIILGVLAGLAMMAKYYTALLLAMMFLFMLINPIARKNFRNKGFYLSLIIFSLIILPHFIWLFHHHFVTFDYAQQRVSNNETNNFYDHIKPSIEFAIKQLAAFSGAVFLFTFALWGKKTEQDINLSSISFFNKQFLWIVGVGPFLLTILLALISGWQLHTMWGTPLLSLWGILLVTYIKPSLNSTRIKHFTIATFCVFFLLAAGYILSANRPNHSLSSSANYFGRPLAERATNIWHAHFHTPLRYVAGDRYLAGYIAVYSKDKPSVFIDWNTLKSPWINVQQFKKEGAIFVQDINSSKKFPIEVLKQFPKLQTESVQYFYSGKKDKPIGIMIGLLPPE